MSDPRFAPPENARRPASSSERPRRHRGNSAVLRARRPFTRLVRSANGQPGQGVPSAAKSAAEAFPAPETPLFAQTFSRAGPSIGRRPPTAKQPAKRSVGTYLRRPAPAVRVRRVLSPSELGDHVHGGSAVTPTLGSSAIPRKAGPEQDSGVRAGCPHTSSGFGPAPNRRRAFRRWWPSVSSVNSGRNGTCSSCAEGRQSQRAFGTRVVARSPRRLRVAPSACRRTLRACR